VLDAARPFYEAHERVEQAEQECRGRYGPPSAGRYAEELKELPDGSVPSPRPGPARCGWFRSSGFKSSVLPRGYRNTR